MGRYGVWVCRACGWGVLREVCCLLFVLLFRPERGESLSAGAAVVSGRTYLYGAHKHLKLHGIE